MLALLDRFGKLPDNIRSRWPQADEVLDKEGNFLNPDDFMPYDPESPGNGDVWQVRVIHPLLGRAIYSLPLPLI